MYKRRQVLTGTAAAIGVVAATLAWWREGSAERGLYASVVESPGGLSGMPYRQFGQTDLKVSELGFGAWGIGGNSYGTAEKPESLAALAVAEELGCNVVDTAAVYGDSEEILGEFLPPRRSKWILSTKYSGQKEGLKHTLESQLRRLRTDYIDFYMLHWLPVGQDAQLLDELVEMKRSGKVRYIGVSLYTALEIDHVLKRPDIDGMMVPMSLLEPYPLLPRLRAIGLSGKGVIVRSALKEGFLAGRFRRDIRFSDPQDLRSQWSAEQIERTVDQVERFRFLEADAGTMARAAIGYPLSFPQVSTVVVGARRVWESRENFGRSAGYRLSSESLERIHQIQKELGLRLMPSIPERLRSLLV